MHVSDVHRMVRHDHVKKSPRYHAGKRGLGYLSILHALEACYAVRKDDRRNEDGTPRFPHGWYALANLPNRQRLRIDFDAVPDENGTLLYIVTAYDA